MSNTNNAVLLTLRGELSYARVLGDPVLNYGKDGKEWKFDLALSPEVVKEAKAHGLATKIKQKDDYLDGRPYMSFKQKEFTSTGKANKPIRVADILDKDWDPKLDAQGNPTNLLGNGTVADVKFQKVDYGKGKPLGVYVRSIRVLKLVPYGSSGASFEAISEDDEFYNEAKAALDALEADKKVADTSFREDFDLEDDIDDVL